VRNQAASIIEHELSLSEESIDRLLIYVKYILQNKKDITIHDAGFIAGLLKAIGKFKDSLNRQTTENEIVFIATDLLKGKTGLLKFIKTEPCEGKSEIISACLSVLGKIGGTKSRDFIRPLSRQDDAWSKVAREAMDELNKRLIYL
jgi:hypothetical protein